MSLYDKEDMDEVQKFLDSMYDDDLQSDRFDVQDVLGCYLNMWPVEDATMRLGVKFLRAMHEQHKKMN